MQILSVDREHILEKTSGIWEPLRNKRLFITGGTGFVGTWLIEAFVAANEAYDLRSQACILTRDPSAFASRSNHLATHESITLQQGDAATFDAPPGEFSHVIHAATQRWFSPDPIYPLGILEPDFVATRRVLDFAKSHGTDRILFTSSGAVYGPSASRLENIAEDFEGAPNPISPSATYGESKRLSEFAVMSYSRTYSFNAIIARLFAFIGPHLPLDEGYAVGNFIADALHERDITIKGDGTPRRSYLYSADLAIWLWTIFLGAESRSVYNVGSPNAISIKDLAEKVVATLAPKAQVHIAASPISGSAPHNYIPNVSRAQNDFQLLAWIDLDEALRRTYQFNSLARRNKDNS